MLLGTRHIHFDPGRLVPHVYAFNPTLHDWNGRLLMAYRFQQEGEHGARTPARLAVADLDPITLQPTRNTILDTGTHHAEDPRFFEANNRLYIAFCCHYWQHIAEIDPVTLQVRRVGAVIADGIPELQKNWVYWCHNQQVWFTYSHQPQHRLFTLDLDTLRCVEVHRHHVNLPWEWGQVRGGSCPAKHYHEMWSFFHSSKRYHTSRVYDGHVYWTGFIVQDSEPPFRITKISRMPILWPDVSTDPPEHRHYAVTFAGGALRRRDTWVVAYGHNDREIRLAEFDAAELDRMSIDIPPGRCEVL